MSQYLNSIHSNFCRFDSTIAISFRNLDEISRNFRDVWKFVENRRQTAKKLWNSLEFSESGDVIFSFRMKNSIHSSLAGTPSNRRRARRAAAGPPLRPGSQPPSGAGISFFSTRDFQIAFFARFWAFFSVLNAHGFTTALRSQFAIRVRVQNAQKRAKNANFHFF